MKKNEKTIYKICATVTTIYATAAILGVFIPLLWNVIPDLGRHTTWWNSIDRMMETVFIVNFMLMIPGALLLALTMATMENVNKRAKRHQ